MAEVLADQAQERRFHRLPLEGLSSDEVGRMMEALIGKAPPAALLDGVYQATEGVPLFVEEMVRLLAQEDRLEGVPSALAIPHSVREVIGRRLDRLSEQTNQVLTVAAVVGREFELAVLKELTDQDEDHLLDLLESALHARLIEEVEGTVGRYRFSHGLTRETLLGDLTATRRVRLHGRVGEALERAYGRDAERHAAELAYHFGQAATLSGAQEKAVRYAVLAAQAAEASHAYEEAIAHYQAALGLMEDTGQGFDQDEVEIRQGLATALQRVFRIADAFRSFRRAMRLAFARGDTQTEAEMAVAQARVGGVAPPILIPTLQRGLQVVADPESELAATMHTMLPGYLRNMGRSEEAEEHRTRAQELLACHPDYLEADVLLALGDFGEALTNLQTDRLPQLARRLEELERRAGWTELAGATTGIVRVLWPLLTGDVMGARQQGERLLEVVRRTRDAYNSVRVFSGLGILHCVLGEFAEAGRMAALAEQWEGADPDWPIVLLRAHVAEAAGDLDQAIALQQRAIALAERYQHTGVPKALLLAGLAALERRAGNTQQTDSVYHDLVEYMERREGGGWLTKQGLVTLARMVAPEAAARRDAPTLAWCRETLEPYHHLYLAPWVGDQGAIARPLGIIAAAEERWEEAIGYLEKATAFCEEKGLVVELAHSRLALADAYRGRSGPGDREKAMSLADQALADYQRLGMPLYVQDALARRELLGA